MTPSRDKTVRVVQIAAIVAAGTFLLSGCERHNLGPGAFSRSGNHLLFAVCQDMVAEQMFGEAETPDGSIMFLSVEGELALRRGDVLKGGVVPAGMRGEFHDVDLNSINSLNVRVVGPDDDFVFGYGSSFGGIQIPSDGWLHPDGSITAEPCETGRASSPLLIEEHGTAARDLVAHLAAGERL